EKRKVEKDRGRHQKPPAGGRALRRTFASPRRSQRGGGLRLRDQHRENGKAEQGGADIGAAPAEVTLHCQERDWRNGRTQHAGKGVKRKNLAELLGWTVMREQGIIRRMISGIAQT